MKLRTLVIFTAIGLLVTLAPSGRIIAGDPPGPTHYRVVPLTLNGPTSFLDAANTINDLSWAMGASVNTTGNQIATLWLYGLQIPLGTIGSGPGSDVSWPNKNNFGLISGISENGVHNPLNETFSCPAFNLLSGNDCVAFAWQFGQITQLPGLGGYGSIGAGNNNLGEVVGWAETAVQDPTCAGTSQPPLVQYLQFEATLWQRDHSSKWHVTQLPPYPTDPDSAATAINDRGQIVGISGQCDVAIGASSAIHSLLWENGKPISLGSLGGSAWNTPQAINNHGIVVGFDNGPNDVVNGQLQFRWHAYIWTKEDGMAALPSLASASGSGFDLMSQATDINNADQIIGVSYADYDFDVPRAFIRQNGTITALNDLIGSASANWDISSTGGINDAGVIAATANPVVNGVVNPNVAQPVLLIPCGPDDHVAYGKTQPFSTSKDEQKQMPRRVQMGHFFLNITPH